MVRLSGDIDGDDNDDTRIKPMTGSRHADTAQIKIIGDKRVPVALARGKAGLAAEPHTCSDCGGTVASGNGKTACVNCGLEHHPGSAAFDEATEHYMGGEKQYLPEMPNQVDFQAVGDVGSGGSMNMTATGEGRRFMTDDDSATQATDFSFEGATGRRGTPTFKNIPFKGIFQRSENPMDMAWRLLKMTPEEMEAQGFHEAAAQMRAMQAEEERVRQQAQAQAPKETPRVQQYDLQLARRRAQEEFEQKLRRARKDSRGGRVDHLFPDIHAFHQEHGRLPKMPKNLKNRFLEYRARMEDE